MEGGRGEAVQGRREERGGAGKEGGERQCREGGRREVVQGRREERGSAGKEGGERQCREGGRREAVKGRREERGGARLLHARPPSYSFWVSVGLWQEDGEAVLVATHSQVLCCDAVGCL